MKRISQLIHVLILAGAVSLTLVQVRHLWASTIYSVVRSGDVYRSSDTGKSWQKMVLSPTVTVSGNSFISVDGRDPAVLYYLRPASSGKTKGGTNSIPPFNRSFDGGRTWEALAAPAVGDISLLAVDPATRRGLYVGTTTGVWRSVDAGTSWTRTAFTTTASTLGVSSGHPGLLLVTSGATIQRSTNYGESFTALAGLPNSRTLTIRATAVDPRNASTLYAAASGSCTDEPAECGLFRSTNAGVSWNRVGVGGTFSSVITRNASVFASGLGPRPASGATPGQVVRSLDGGVSWTSVTAGIGNNGLRVFFDPDAEGNLYAVPEVGTGGRGFYDMSGLFISTNQGSSFTLNRILPQSATGSDAVDELAVATGVAAVPGVTHVSAASNQVGTLAPNSIATARGTALAVEVAVASTNPAPTSLGGASVEITDSQGVKVLAPLFYASPTQINYLIPGTVAAGRATVTVVRNGTAGPSEAISIAEVSPGLFVLNPLGLAAVVVLRVSGGEQSFENIYQVASSGQVVANPIDFGPPGDQIYFLLYGTGFRNAGTANTKVTLSGVETPVLYAGAGDSPGLDQANFLVPRTLAGRGEIELTLTAAGLKANTVRFAVK